MEKINNIINYLDKLFPEAECELIHKNALELLIAVMLSAQSTDKSVNKITIILFDKYKTCNDYVSSTIEELQNDIRKIGLYKNKAKNLYNLNKILIKEFNSEVPNTQEGLESLPGVGRKTANVVLSVWFKVPRIAVDTHVERVSKRLKLAYRNDNVRKVEDKLMKKIPKDKWSEFHHKLIFFGRYFCKSQNPNCKECKLMDYCNYKNK